MSHLGSRISALVDGQLSVADTERALAHVAVCPECSAELAASRAARRALASADEMAPAPDLTARLLSLAASTEPAGGDPFAPPVRQSRDELASYGVASGGLGARGWRSGSSLRGDVGQRRSSVRIAAGSMAGLGAVAAMLFVLGERPDVVPSVHPGADLTLLGQAVTVDPATRTGSIGTAAWPVVTDESADTETTSWLRAHEWSFPQELPDGWSVTAVRWSGDDAGVLEVDVLGPDGASLVVTEQQGRLDTTALAGAPTGEVGGREVYVLSYEPWHVVWQADATVVQVVGSQSSDDAATLVGAFPGGAFDDGVPARITRGWDTVTGALERP
ncbi:zf-HC2 domain-containing protein [Cellulomonas sp. P5_E12]